MFGGASFPKLRALRTCRVPGSDRQAAIEQVTVSRCDFPWFAPPVSGYVGERKWPAGPVRRLGLDGVSDGQLGKLGGILLSTS